MSNRPNKAAAVLSRVRRPASRLRDLPIWSKLGLIMIVPTLATITVGMNGLIDHYQTSTNADRARTLSKLSSNVGLLVHNLQDERAAATLLLSRPTGAAADANVDAYRKLFPGTDQAAKEYALRRNGLTDLPPTFVSLLRRLDNQLSALPTLREQVAGRKSVSLTSTMFFYRVLAADLLTIREASAQIAGETTLSDRMRAAAAVSTMKEFLAQERVVVLRVLGEGVLTSAREREFVHTLTGQDQAQGSFATAATPEERAILDQEVSGDDLRLAEKYEGRIEMIAGGGRFSDLGFGSAEWDAAFRERGNLLRKVEVILDNRMEAQATELRDAVVRQVLIETGLLLGMLLVAILFAWLVARSMARSLRELRHGALAVAQYGLPQAVSRLRDPALATQMSPAQIARQIAEPLPVRSKDEFGQVTEAFNAVHMEAVRTAAEQAALRSSVATMFVNLARRSQILVDRLIGHLDRLERGEEDPDRLAELFQLDHLATRMRRNDENLLVLAGADSTRVQREPAALLDVLRAAQSEVEHYTRIEFGVIDRDIEVAAHAVNDLVHLVAELLDNATAFSPPDSAVIVEARRVGDRAVLLVEDRGIGVSAEQLAELNERLATPPLVDVAVSRMMGLVVVARLASRHGVKVELRPARENGMVADVTMPTSVLVPRALAGRATAGAPMPGRQPAAPSTPPAQRRALGAPLALESGQARVFEAPMAPAVNGAGEYPADAGTSRGMPAWSDLTGAGGVNGSDMPGVPRGGSGGTLPQRRPSESRTVDGEATGGPLIPRQIPLTPQARPNGYAPGPIPPVSAPPSMYPPLPPVSGAPMVVPPVSAPPSMYPPVSTPYGMPAPVDTRPGGPPLPVWPPVAPQDDHAPPPPVPGDLAAALDMTAEIPKIRVDEEPPVAVRPSSGGGMAPAAPDPRAARFADETMELPIFRELESAWFRTRRAVIDETIMIETTTGIDLDHAPGRAAAQSVSADEPMITAPTPGGQSRTPAAETSLSWQTAADDGWRAATAAADAPVTRTTDAGLPKRVPMAQLVPGGVDKGSDVEKGTGTIQRRTPEAVRGLLSAYHRGVKRGRAQPKDSDGLGHDAAHDGLRPEGTGRKDRDAPSQTVRSKTPEPTTTGPQNSQAGKEHEA